MSVLKAKVVLVLIALMSILVVAQDAENDAKKLYNDGNQLYKQRDYEGAAAKYNAAASTDPANATYPLWAGNALRYAKKYSESETAYKKAIQVDNQVVDAYLGLGYVQMRLDKLNEAATSYRAAVKIDASNAKAYDGLGDVNAHQKDWTQAVTSYKKATELDATLSSSWQGLGLALTEQGNDAAAADAYFKAAETEKKKYRHLIGANYLRQGDALLKLKRYDEAEVAYKNCIQISNRGGHKAAANFGLGELSKKRGQSQQAIQYFELAKKDRSWRASAEYEIDALKNPDKYAY